MLYREGLEGRAERWGTRVLFETLVNRGERLSLRVVIKVKNCRSRFFFELVMNFARVAFGDDLPPLVLMSGSLSSYVPPRLFSLPSSLYGPPPPAVISYTSLRVASL